MCRETIWVLTANFFFIWTVRRCQRGPQIYALPQKPYHRQKQQRRSVHGGSHEPMVHTGRSGLMTSKKGRRKQTTSSRDLNGKSVLQRDGKIVASSVFVTASDHSRHTEKSLEDTDGNDETLDEVTWGGFDASGTSVTARHHGKRRVRPKTAPVDIGGGEMVGKKESKAHSPSPNRADSESRKKKDRLVKERMSLVRTLKMEPKPHRMRSAPHNMSELRKTPDTTRKGGAIERASPATTDKRLKQSQVREAAPHKPKRRRHSSDQELYRPIRSHTANDLSDNRSETSIVCKRDSWIWFSPETRPSVENFVSRQRKFQSEDPRVAALAAEIRRQEELNKDIERTAESLIDSSSSGRLQKVGREANRKSEWSGGKHRVCRARARERVSPYVRPQDRYVTKRPTTDRQGQARVLSPPGPEVAPTPYSRQPTPLRRVGKEQRIPSFVSVRKIDKKIQTKGSCLRSFFSPLTTEYVRRLAPVASSGSSSSSIPYSPQMDSKFLLSPRSQPVFYYNSPSAKIIKRSPTPGRYSPLYDNSTLMTSHTCSPAGEDFYLLRATETRSTQTTPHVNRARKESFVSQAPTSDQPASKPQQGVQLDLDVTKPRKHWSRSYLRERHSERNAMKSSAPSADVRQPEVASEKASTKTAVTLRAVRDSNSPSGFRAVIDVKSPPATRVGEVRSGPDNLRLLSDSHMSGKAVGEIAEGQEDRAGKTPTSPTKANAGSYSAADSLQDNVFHTSYRGGPSQPVLKTNSVTSLSQTDAIKGHWRKSPPITLSTGDSESESYGRDKPSADTSFRQAVISKEVNTAVYRLLFDTEQSSSSLSPSIKLKNSRTGLQQPNRTTLRADHEPPYSQNKSQQINKTTTYGHFPVQSNQTTKNEPKTETPHSCAGKASGMGRTNDITSTNPEQTSPRVSCSRESAERTKRTNIYTRDYYLGKKVAMRKQQEAVKKAPDTKEASKEDLSSRWKKSETKSWRTLSSRCYSPASRTSLVRASNEADADSKDINAEAVQTGQGFSCETAAPHNNFSNKTDAGAETSQHVTSPCNFVSDVSQQVTVKRRGRGSGQVYQRASVQQRVPHKRDPCDLYQSDYPELGFNTQTYRRDSPIPHKDGSCEAVGHSYRPCAQPPSQLSTSKVTGLGSRKKGLVCEQSGQHVGSGSTNNSSSNLPYGCPLPDLSASKSCLGPPAPLSFLAQVKPFPGRLQYPQSDPILPLAKDPHIDALDHLQLCVEPLKYGPARAVDTALQCVKPSSHTFMEDSRKVDGFGLEACPESRHQWPLTSGQTSSAESREDLGNAQGQQAHSSVVTVLSAQMLPDCPHSTSHDVPACHLQLPPTSSDEEETSADTRGQTGKEGGGHQVKNSSNPDSGYDESMSDRTHSALPQTMDCPVSTQGQTDCGQSGAHTLQAATGQGVRRSRSVSSSSDTSPSWEDMAQRSTTSNDGGSEHDTLLSFTDEGLQSVGEIGHGETLLSTYSSYSADPRLDQAHGGEVVVKHDDNGLWSSTDSCAPHSPWNFRGADVETQYPTDPDIAKCAQNHERLSFVPHSDVITCRAENPPCTSADAEVVQQTIAASDVSSFQIDLNTHRQSQKSSKPERYDPGVTTIIDSRQCLNGDSEIPQNLPPVVNASSQSPADIVSSSRKQNLSQTANLLGSFELSPERNSWSSNCVVLNSLEERGATPPENGLNGNIEQWINKPFSVSELPVKSQGKENTLSSLGSCSELTGCSLSLDIYNCALETSSPLSIQDVDLCLSENASVSSSSFPSLSAKQTDGEIELSRELAVTTNPLSIRSGHSTQADCLCPPVVRSKSVTTALLTGRFCSAGDVCPGRTGQMTGTQDDTCCFAGKDWKLECEQDYCQSQLLSRKETLDIHVNLETGDRSAHCVSLPPTSSDEEDENVWGDESNIRAAMFTSKEQENKVAECLSVTLACPTASHSTHTNNTATLTLGPAKPMISQEVKFLTEAQKRAMIPERSKEFAELLKRF